MTADQDQRQRDDHVFLISVIVAATITALILAASWAMANRAHQTDQYCPHTPGTEGCQ